jgi:uncharacterized phage infection (PIP) family protein YhgE
MVLKKEDEKEIVDLLKFIQSDWEAIDEALETLADRLNGISVGYSDLSATVNGLTNSYDGDESVNETIGALKAFLKMHYIQQMRNNLQLLIEVVDESLPQTAKLISNFDL